VFDGSGGPLATNLRSDPSAQTPALIWGLPVCSGDRHSADGEIDEVDGASQGIEVP
jgi:hypothetical protein